MKMQLKMLQLQLQLQEEEEIPKIIFASSKPHHIRTRLHDLKSYLGGYIGLISVPTMEVLRVKPLD